MISTVMVPAPKAQAPNPQLVQVSTRFVIAQSKSPAPAAGACQHGEGIRDPVEVRIEKGRISNLTEPRWRNCAPSQSR